MMADGQHGERAPLLVNENRANDRSPDTPSSYQDNVPGRSGTTSSSSSSSQLVRPLSSNELPLPYTPTPQGGIPMINCKVCQAMINIEGKLHQHVVKCSVCHEATPIKAAPPGKKYVRCPCHCLLICKGASQRIACPRPDCKRIINLSPAPTVMMHSPGTSHIECAHCAKTFLFNVRSTSLVRCPHCRRVSAVGPSYVRKKAIIYTVLGVILLGSAIALTVTTHNWAVNDKGLYAAWGVAYLLTALFLMRALCLGTMKVSHTRRPV